MLDVIGLNNMEITWDGIKENYYENFQIHTKVE